MKTINNIPTGKIKRAANLLKTGAKVGGNYVKYYRNLISKSKEEATATLHEDNAEDVYDSLKTLKGSALKVAQMLSMDQGVLPKAYVDKFSLSQFSVPALSYPLVVKSFKRAFNKFPNQVFDKFEKEAVHAASIGQVHIASKNDKKFAVKIQYPGVADSIESDLALVKPIALRLLNIDGAAADVYFQEVKKKLIEETDYENELMQGTKISQDCKDVRGLVFPKYYKEYSSAKILTMDFMEGVHLSEFCLTQAGTKQAGDIGQYLWSFYMFQLHKLRKVHADPHPGNFLVSETNELIALDFGCMKEIPENFYEPYFRLIDKGVIEDDNLFTKALIELEILRPDDNDEVINELKSLFKPLLVLITRPFRSEVFDFSDEGFISEIKDLANKMMNDKSIKDQDAGRGSKHFIYMNRTLFGLYNLMMDLKAKQVKVDEYGLFV